MNNNENVLNVTDYSYKAYVTTINHRLLMLNIIYLKDLVIEHSITQITYISILTNIQLMCLITIR